MCIHSLSVELVCAYWHLPTFDCLCACVGKGPSGATSLYGIALAYLVWLSNQICLEGCFLTLSLSLTHTHTIGRDGWKLHWLCSLIHVSAPSWCLQSRQWATSPLSPLFTSYEWGHCQPAPGSLRMCLEEWPFQSGWLSTGTCVCVLLSLASTHPFKLKPTVCCHE